MGGMTDIIDNNGHMDMIIAGQCTDVHNYVYVVQVELYKISE